jgi:hypothetical protein
MYTLTNPEWKALAVIAQTSAEAIPDYSYSSLDTPDPNDPKQADIVQSVVNTIGMLSGDNYTFMEGELRALLQPMMHVAREFLEDNPCDHEVGICFCQLIRSHEVLEHVMWHLNGTTHSHCETCNVPALGDEFGQCWACASSEHYPK